MTNKIDFQNAKTLSDSDKAIIKKSVESSLVNASRLLGIKADDVSVEVRDNHTAEPGLLVTGWAEQDGQKFGLKIDPKTPVYRDEPKHISSAVAHECHHLLRLRCCGYDNAGDNIVLEGLAQIFEMESGHERPAYSLALGDNDLLLLAKHMKNWQALDAPHYDSEYSRESLLYGAKSEGNFQYKHWGGYHLGFELMRAWLDYINILDGKESTAVSCSGVKTEKVLQAWLDLKFFLPVEVSENRPQDKVRHRRIATTETPRVV